ncbi:integrase, catalytic region, zinc finger, CCHC-type containing protein [Tanacetum coccineum]
MLPSGYLCRPSNSEYIVDHMNFKLKKASHNVSKEIGRGASGIVYKGVLVDNKVSAIKRLEEFSNNQGDAKLIAADISTLGRLNHMNLIEFWGTVLRESTECWCTSTWKMGEDLAASICGLSDCEKVVPSEVVVDKDDETLVLVFDEALGVGDGVLEIKTYVDGGVTFKIPVGNVPSELTALSNMPVSEETIDGDFKTVSFEESPLMSTYLVAVVVGLFDYIEETTSDGIKVRAYCSVGKSEKGKLALSISVKSIELYTNTPNTLRLSIAVTHEFGHQWFGNLVTLEWWTYLWLNEGFATWVSYLETDSFFSEWNIWTQFLEMTAGETEILNEIPDVYNPNEVGERNETESLVYIKRSYMTDNVSQLTVCDDDLGMAHDFEDVFRDMKDFSTALWRRYELKTTRLSQELTEYHYRKDRIWLRRTRPNKRNYQVVIAIDDSSSMSENNCGNVAIEALVMVCPAMSQLEVGNLAVASFGKGENIQLLHDFDRPFIGEAGVQVTILSKLGFQFIRSWTFELASQIRRVGYLKHLGYEVKYVRNFTNIDDKDMMEPTVSPDGSWHQNRVGASYMDNGSLMYLMSGYNPYGLQSFLGEGMSGCLWILNTPMSRNTKVVHRSRQSTSDLSELLQSPHLWSLNQVRGTVHTRLQVRGTVHTRWQGARRVSVRGCRVEIQGNNEAVGGEQKDYNTLRSCNMNDTRRDALTDEQYRQEDIQELMSKLLEDVRNINEELSEYINCPSWNCPIFFDDDDEYTIIYSKPKAITPDLPIEEPDNSLSMGDEHLNTIPSVENLVSIPSELEGISDDTCEDPSTFDALSDHSEILSDPNDDGTSSDDDDFEDIEYVSLEEVNDVDQEEKEFDLEDILQIQDVILREKLLNINRLIANIESLNDNSTPNCVLKSTSPFPIPDSNSFFKKSDTSLSYSDNSLPEFESFSDHTEETSSGSTTTHANNSLPEYDSFHFEIEPDQGELTNVVMGEPRVHVPNVLPTHPTLMMDSDVIIRTFLPYFTYPMDSSFPLSSGSEDTIFDPGISTFHFSSLKPVAYENPIVIFLFFCFCPKDKGIRGEIPQDHEDPCLFSILQSSGLRSFAYFGILNPDHQQPEFSQPNSSLVVPVFQKGDDPIDAINHMMSFLTTLVTSRYLTTNNQLRTSSNPCQQATIYDGKVTVQPVQGRQTTYAAGTTRKYTPRASGSNTGKQWTVICYNCKGEGHIAKQCNKPKRKKDETWFNDKVLLVQSQASGQALTEEEIAFLADPGLLDIQTS